MEAKDELAAKVLFFNALNKVQGTLEPVVKDSVNPHFKSRYASLAAVNATIMGPLAENGFVLMQGGTEVAGKVWLKTTLTHKGGHSESFIYPLNVTSENPQAMASAISYARRYSLCALLNLSTEDDDAETATAPHRAAASPAPAPRKPSPEGAQPEPSSLEKWEGVVPDVEVKGGEGPKGPYTKFTVKVDGKYLTTFDENTGEFLHSSRNNQTKATIYYRKSGKYFNIVKVELPNVKTPEPPKVEIDEIPF